MIGRTERRDLLLASAGLGLALLLACGTPANPFDEGFAAYYGWRIGAGAWPYRDFWAYYAPGQFFALGALNKLLAPWTALQLWDALVRVALPLLIYAWARALGARWHAWLAWGLAAIALLAAGGSKGYALFPALLLGLSALHLLWRGKAFEAGAALGVAAFIRQDAGLYLLALSGLWLILRERGALLRFGAGLAWGSALWVPVILQAGWTPFWEQVYTYPSTLLHAGYHLPYPPLLPRLRAGLGAFAHDIHVWMQFYGTLLLAAWLGWDAWRTRRWERLLLLGFALLLFSQALNRPDAIHRLPAWLLLLPLLASAPWARLGRGAAVVLLLIALHWAVEPAFRFGAALRAGLPGSEDWGQAQAALALKRLTAEGEPIYVVNRRMDTALVNDVQFYVLAQRPAGADLVEFHPGLSTDERVQAGLIAQLDGRKVRWIVRCSRFEGLSEPNLSAVPGSARLDAWIDGAFVARQRFGAYELWERKG